MVYGLYHVVSVPTSLMTISSACSPSDWNWGEPKQELTNLPVHLVLLVKDKIVGAALELGQLFRSHAALFGKLCNQQQHPAVEDSRRIRRISLPEEHFLGCVASSTHR